MKSIAWRSEPTDVIRSLAMTFNDSERAGDIPRSMRAGRLAPALSGNRILRRHA